MIATISGIPVYQALVTDPDTGMLKISLVDDPAVMSRWQALENARPYIRFKVADEDRRLVRGVVMRADFPIYRIDPAIGEYYVIYTADTIRQMAEKYLLESRQNNVNTMHAADSDVDGVNMVQYFIKDSAAGVSPEGFADIADGSLFAEFHVTNDEVWDAVRNGTYQGFSLEGIFDLEPERDADKVRHIVDGLDGKFSSQDNKEQYEMSKLNKLMVALHKMLATFGSVTTDRGVLAWDGDEDLKAGDEVFIIDQEGNRTAAEDGDYTTEDKKVIAVVDGRVSEIRDPEAEVTGTDAADDPERAEEDFMARRRHAYEESYDEKMRLIAERI